LYTPPLENEAQINKNNYATMLFIMLFRECLSNLLPIITKIVNVSLTEAVVRSGLKAASLHPLLKVSVRGKFAILHNFTFLSGWINLKVIFKIKKTPRKNLISAGGYCARKIVLHINYLIES